MSSVVLDENSKVGDVLEHISGSCRCVSDCVSKKTCFLVMAGVGCDGDGGGGLIQCLHQFLGLLQAGVRVSSAGSPEKLCWQVQTSSSYVKSKVKMNSEREIRGWGW